MGKSISDFKEGDKISSEFDGLTRDLIVQYANSSGDTNPIHTRDEVAERMGLKGVIAHGLFSLGFIVKLLDELVKDTGEILKTFGEMRGQVRPGDKLITELTVKSVEGNVVNFDVLQKTITKIKIEKDGKLVESFEAEEKGWISTKDVTLNLVKSREIEGKGILSYRERPCIIGSASIQLNL
jgi:acyl dehydratase